MLPAIKFVENTIRSVYDWLLPFRQLKMLEDELHTQLFFRDKNKLLLTPKGKLLKQYAQRIVRLSQQAMQDPASWMYRDFSELNIAATYNLLFNASLMVREGLRYALCLYNLFDFSDNSSLCFRPLSPAVLISLQIIGKKHCPLSNAAQYFLEVLTRQIAQMPEILPHSTSDV